MHHTRADGSPYPRAECKIHATLRDGVARRVEDEVFWRKDGTSFPAAYICTAIRDEAGEINEVVVAFRDITERKRAQEELISKSALLEAQLDSRWMEFWLWIRREKESFKTSGFSKCSRCRKKLAAVAAIPTNVAPRRQPDEGPQFEGTCGLPVCATGRSRS